jgi:hypothetical protein
MGRSKLDFQTLDKVSFETKEQCRSFPVLEHFALDDSQFVAYFCLIDVSET